MRAQRRQEQDTRIQQALAELQGMIAQHYPAAGFEVFRGQDPDGVYLRATVDVEDTDEVVDVFIDRLVDLQVEERLPLYVVPVRPMAKVVAAGKAAGKLKGNSRTPGGHALLGP